MQSVTLLGRAEFNDDETLQNQFGTMLDLREAEKCPGNQQLNVKNERILLDSSRTKASYPPFLSNSDGAKYIKEQVELSEKLNQRRRSNVAPIFLGGKFLNKTFGNSERVNPNIESVSSIADEDCSNPFPSTQYLLFPTYSEDIVHDPSKTKSTSSLDVMEEIGKIESFNNTREAEENFVVDKRNERELIKQPSDNILQRRRSSISVFTTIQSVTGSSEVKISDRNSRKYRLPKRATVQLGQITRLSRNDSFPHSESLRLGKNRSPRNASILSEFTKATYQENSGQNRVRHKAFSQAEGINHRFLQRRLRVGYLSHEFLRELRMQRKRKHQRSYEPLTPYEKFRRIASVIRLLLRCLDNYRKISVVSHVSQMSFAMLSSDLVATRSYRGGLTFEPNDYRAVTESCLNDKVKYILTIVPHQRTDKQAVKRLRASVEEFAEFPLRMQEALVRVAWLDEFEPKRIIIRQGHKAETFYLIISGTALITRNKINRSGEGYVETVSILKRGKSFGELAIIRHEQRNNNVVSQTHLTLLTVGRKDFIEIFMHRMDGGEPEFMVFLRNLPEFKGYPLYKLPRNKPQICAFTYFRVGVVICPNSNESDVIVVVKSGFCRVVKCLPAKRPNISELKASPFDLEHQEKVFCGSHDSLSTYRQSHVLLPSLGSPVSLLTGPIKPSLIHRERSPKNCNSTKIHVPSETNQSTKKNIELHKAAIQREYKKWQENHPISRETFALLMTGRDIEQDNDDVEEELGESSDGQQSTFDSFPLQQYDVEEKDGNYSRRESMESNYRTHILKRNRTSLVDAWSLKQRKKVSSAAASLPTLNENALPRPSFAELQYEHNQHTKSVKPVYIHIQTLGERDVFGLLPILFDKSEGATTVSLISEGAECILINKDFFMKHFDSELRESLIRKVRPYPTEEKLQSSMQDQANWDAYKLMTVHTHMTSQIRTKHLTSTNQ